MDPIAQTLLTLACMGGAYIWGWTQGFKRSLVVVSDLLLDSFKMKDIEINFETSDIIFIDSFGIKRKASEAWNNEV